MLYEYYIVVDVISISIADIIYSSQDHLKGHCSYLVIIVVAVDGGYKVGCSGDCHHTG